MSRFPTLTAKKVLQALERGGFELTHSRGSHLYLAHPITMRHTGVSMHPGDLKRGLVKIIIKQAGYTEAQFRKLL